MGRIRQTYRKYTIRKSKLKKYLESKRKRGNQKRCSKCGRFM